MTPEPPGDAPETDPRALLAAAAAEAEAAGDGKDPRTGVSEPDKVLRIATMVRELLDETRQAPPDERGRVMLRGVYERAVDELSEVLSDDLKRELESLAPPMDTVPTESEIRVAQALLVGWLEGLFHGIQAAMYAQQMAARAQFDELRRRSLPPGMQGGLPGGMPGGGGQNPGESPPDQGGGQYL